MQAFQQFQIIGQHYDPATHQAHFVYAFDHEIQFTETLQLPYGKALPGGDISSLLFHIGIALGISYYKLYPTQTILVENGSLTTEQAKFWQDFYLQGLGEFFYTNQLAPSGLAQFESVLGEATPHLSYQPGQGFLVPIGGGKDSNVSISLLQEAGFGDQIMLYTNGKDYPVHQGIQEVSGLPRVLTSRHIDPLLLQMNKEGYYNGHVPITGMISFISLLVALISDKNHIVFSNERSANFGNTQRKGLEINHQWSKSYDFELAFVEYVQRYISKDIHYFSLIRPYHELRIAQKMSELKQYLPVFTSCNRNFHYHRDAESLRCGVCPKCHFTYMIMRPFLTSTEVEQIWGQEYFANPNLLPQFQELRGVEGFKPFECVGTYEESQVAAWMASQNEELSTLPILQWFIEHLAGQKTTTQWHAMQEELLSPEKEGLGNIPSEFLL